MRDLDELDPPQRLVIDGGVYELAIHPSQQVSMHIELPSRTKEAVRSFADQNDTSIKAIVEQALTAYLNR